MAKWIRRALCLVVMTGLAFMVMAAPSGVVGWQRGYAAGLLLAFCVLLIVDFSVLGT